MEYDRTLPHRNYFYEIAQIPHGSGNEQALSDYLVAFAQAHGLEYVQDGHRNVIIRKGPSAGYEKAAPLAIQAHMDMVCEKNKDTVHNFETDPLRFVVSDDGILKADGTTLGADDGTGVAYMLALLSDPDLKHPPLECIFTTDEEVGMFGALALKPEDVRARRLISLDGGGETTTLLTSAGGACLRVRLPMAPAPNDRLCLSLRIRGLAGGHSGGEIHKERGNANKLMARILKEALRKGEGFRLCAMNGGLKDNAIPRECDAVVCPDDLTAFTRAAETSAAAIAAELEFSDGGFRLETEEVSPAPTAFSPEDSRKAVTMLYLYPNGFQARSMAIEGLTMTSLNLGIVRTDDEGLYATVSLRSMLGSCVDDLHNRIDEISALFGAQVKREADYPGWNYSPVSPMRDILAGAVQDLYDGKELTLRASHGGTECGVFSALHPGMDIISMGPIAQHVHTPDEELDLASFDRVYRLLSEVVTRCK